jgi:hypothetical protein
MLQENLLYVFQIEMDKLIHIMKWYKSGQVLGYIDQSTNLKSPLLNPTNHPTDAQSLSHAKPQVVSVTIPLGGIYINDELTSTIMSQGGSNGVSPAIGANSFQTVLQTIQQFNPIPAPGAMETVQVRTMQPLSGSSQANQDTIMNTQLGIVTVAIS